MQTTMTHTCKECEDTGIHEDDFNTGNGLCCECDAKVHEEAWDVVTRLLDKEDKAVEVLEALRAAGLLK